MFGLESGVELDSCDGRAASTRGRSISHWYLVHVVAHRVVEASGLDLEHGRIEARVGACHIVQRIAQNVVQGLDLLVGAGRGGQEALTVAYLAAELIAQSGDLLLEALDALTVALLARLELLLRLHLRGANALQL